MLWKIYFWLYVIIFFGFVAFGDFPWQPVDIVSVITNAIAVLAAYGYLYKKRFFNRGFWEISIPIFIGFWLLYIFVLDKMYGGYPPEFLEDYLAGLLAPLPIYILAYRYKKFIDSSVAKSASIQKYGLHYYWGNAIAPLAVILMLLLILVAETSR